MNVCNMIYIYYNSNWNGLHFDYNMFFLISVSVTTATTIPAISTTGTATTAIPATAATTISTIPATASTTISSTAATTVAAVSSVSAVFSQPAAEDFRGHLFPYDSYVTIHLAWNEPARLRALGGSS